MKEYTWSNNEDDEYWNRDFFDTKEDCIGDAIENYGLEKGDSIAIGTVNPFIVYIDAEDVLERLEESAFEQCGEACESWIDYKKDSINELSERLTACVNQWLKETNQEPNFYGVEDIETVEIDF